MCEKNFKNLWECFKPKRCPICSQFFARSSLLYKHTHKKTKHNCHHCNKVFCDEARYQGHIRSLCYITGHTIHDHNQRNYPETGYESEGIYQEVIEKKINQIRDHTKNNKDYKVFNRQINPSFKYSEINDFLLNFYTIHTNGFRIDLELGYDLYHYHLQDLQVSLCKYEQFSIRKSCCDN